MQNWNDLVSEVTLTYSSADAPVYTVSTSEDLTDLISLGMRLRLTQSTGGTKYFIVVAITNSTIKLYGGTDYTLANEAITSPVFSSAKVPFGFPSNPEKWTEVTTDNQTRTQSSPSNGTWYNLGSISLNIPIGVWSLEYFVNMNVVTSGAHDVDMYVTLSTANNSESDSSMSLRNALTTPSNGNIDFLTPANRRRYLTLASKTSYYLNAKTSTSPSSINYLGADGLTIIRAVCAYL